MTEERHGRGMTAREQGGAAGQTGPAAPDEAVVVCLARARRTLATERAAEVEAEDGQRERRARLLGAYNLHNG
jgi:hypothetical protein